ncbi:hypothetical protein predicted by Glimmer/Critica [Acetobacter ghanensis]|uniref:Uncharacterized protein n=1 Tax=Acetobacter ghanensis TaxID=431306 RepID=A0A0U5F566_9PROT|nr:hypothetical protein predicted by Glimmer/Critica [Acetobacter ghanensis]
MTLFACVKDVEFEFAGHFMHIMTGFKENFIFP